MRVAALYRCTAIPGLQSYLFRRIRDDLGKNHMEGPKGFRALLDLGGLRHHRRGRDPLLQRLEDLPQDPKDFYKYQGAEIHVLLIDELTHFLEPMYRFLRSRVRMVGLEVPETFQGQIPADPVRCRLSQSRLTSADLADITSGQSPGEICRRQPAPYFTASRMVISFLSSSLASSESSTPLLGGDGGGMGFALRLGIRLVGLIH